MLPAKRPYISVSAVLTFVAAFSLLVASSVSAQDAAAAAAAAAAASGQIPADLPPAVQARIQQAMAEQQGGGQTAETGNGEQQQAQQEAETQDESQQEQEQEQSEEVETEEPVPAVSTPSDDEGPRPYGYQIFREMPASFAPVDYGPVDPSYRIGPGDELVVQTWGEVELSYRPTVARDGSITLPIVGQITVSGLTVDELERRLLLHMARYHQSLRTDGGAPASHLSVSLGRLRPISVFVLGEVTRPGAYTMGAATTAFQALYAAGGPTIRGSLRRICIMHADASVDTLDGYDYIMRGRRDRDVRLKHMEVVFIPVIGRTVQVTGAVRRSGIYELRGREQVTDLLEFAGGLAPDATPQFSQILRIVDSERRLIDVSLADSASVPIRDGDVLDVGSALADVKVTVTAEGSVMRPRAYNWNEGMKVSDLLRLAEGLQDDAYPFRADIVRRLPDGRTTILTCRPDSILAGDESADVALFPYDRLVVRSLFYYLTPHYVSVEGEVRSPGRYEHHESMHVSDLLFAAGGATEVAYLDRAVVIRLKDDGTRETIAIDLRRIVAGDRSADVALEADDVVRIRSVQSFVTDEQVGLYGEVRQEGPQPFREGMLLSDLLFAGGGLTPSAYTREVLIHRRYLSGDQAWSDTLTVSVPTHLDEAEPMNWPAIPLQPGDNVVVRPRPDWTRPSVMSVLGRVNFPGYYILETRSERVVDIINRAGGVSPDAFIPEAHIKRPNTGRVPLDLEDAINQPQSHHNIFVLPGDTLVIPRQPQTVRIQGAVNFPTNAVYVPGEDVGYYLDQAGGVVDSADVGHAYIVHYGGRIQKAQFCWMFWRDIPPGATLVVPYKKQRPPTSWGDTVRDIITFTGATATTILLILQVSKEL